MDSCRSIAWKRGTVINSEPLWERHLCKTCLYYTVYKVIVKQIRIVKWPFLLTGMLYCHHTFIILKPINYRLVWNFPIRVGPSSLHNLKNTDSTRFLTEQRRQCNKLSVLVHQVFLVLIHKLSVLLRTTKGHHIKLYGDFAEDIYWSSTPNP
jgi:hypothetical protein